MNKEVFIVFFSANGSTRRVADIIQEGFAERDAAVSVFSLGGADQSAGLRDRLLKAGSQACLFLGSPVYRDGAVPVVMNFLADLPPVNGAAAVPFVTWGKACSGLALWQMGSALVEKGFFLAGAAKVLAVHSLMWRVKQPPGNGRPDPEDRRQLLAMVDTLWRRFTTGDDRVLPIDRLDYQPDPQSEEIKKKIAAPWMIVPKTVDQNACTQCGLCEEECPVEAVTLDPFPEIDQTCCDCFNCIRLCPEDAIEPKISMDQIEGMIWERVNTIDEKPYTEIFL